MGGFLKKLTEKLSRPLKIDSHRAAALALLVAALGLIVSGMLYPLVSLQGEYRETLDRERFKLRQLNRIASQKGALSQRLDNIKAMNQKNEAFLPTTTAALASAELQTRIKEIVTDAGGELASTQVIPEKPEENITRVGVKIRLNGSTPILRNILHAFESGKKALFIDNLNIRPIRMPVNPRDKNAGPEDRLSVDFDVIGFMQTP